VQLWKDAYRLRYWPAETIYYYLHIKIIIVIDFLRYHLSYLFFYQNIIYFTIIYFVTKEKRNYKTYNFIHFELIFHIRI
jgi:hypothetical protein